MAFMVLCWAVTFAFIFGGFSLCRQLVLITWRALFGG